MALAFLLCCYENVSPAKALKAFLAFLFSFISIFLYLIFSEFTKWYTVLWVSFVISFLFTLGFILNVYLRCAAYLFFVHMFFSRLGLMMLFVSGSWMTIQTGMGAQRRNQLLQNQYLLEIEDDEISNPHLNSVDYLLGIIHYASLVPYFCIYVYSVLFEVTYECRRAQRSSSKSSHGIVYEVCKRLFKYAVLLVVFGFFVATLVVYSIQWHNYQNMISQFNAKNLDTSVLVECPFKWLIFYGIFTGIIAILSFFSHFMIKFRKPIIKKHFKFSSSNVHAKEDNFYLSKPKQVRPKKFKKHKRSTHSASHNQGLKISQVEYENNQDNARDNNGTDTGSECNSDNISDSENRCAMSWTNETVQYKRKPQIKYPTVLGRVSPIDWDEENKRLSSSRKYKRTSNTTITKQPVASDSHTKVMFDTSGSSDNDN